jgi:glycosyltransferase involved in cell wall biosynthesis
MSADVSILTAVYRPEPDHLRAAWESVQRQQGVSWEWVIQVDGTDDDLVAWLPAEARADDRVRAAATGRRFDVAITRNLGLVRCEGDLVQHLDQDDLLLPGALAAGAERLRADERLAFCFGEVSYLLPDGSIEPRPDFKRLEPGVKAAGEITARWRRGDPYGFVTNSLMWRKRYLYAYGGWAALPVWADTGIIFPVADRHPVASIDHETVLYRRHPRQASRDPDAQRLVEAQRPFIPRRLDAMRRISGAPAEADPGAPDSESDADVSILTALFRPEPDHVIATWESIQAQQGVSWEWVVQADGSEEELRQWLPEEVRADPRVRAGANGRRFEVAITRNLGLVRCGAECVQQLDQDELLAAGALAAAVEALSQNADAAFCAGAAGTAVEEAGAVLWRRRNLYAYGGWPALPVHPGAAIARIVGERHPVVRVGQETVRPGPQRPPDDATARLADAQRPFVAHRLAAMRQVLDGGAASG